MSLLYFPIIISLFGIVLVWFSFLKNKKQFSAAERALAILSAVREAASIYTKKPHKIIGVAGIVLFILLFFIGWKVAVGFLLGAIFSALAGFVGAVIEGSAKKPTSSLMAMSFGLLIVSFYYAATNDIGGLVGLVFGAGFISFFPAIKNRGIAIAYEFGTYVLVLVASMILGAILFPRSGQFILLPLVLSSVAILALVVGSFFAKKEAIASLIISAIGFYLIIEKLMVMQAISAIDLCISALAGLTVVAIGLSIKNNKLKKYFIIAAVILLGALAFWLAGFYGLALMVLSAILVSSFAIEKGISSALAAALLSMIYFTEVSNRGVMLLNWRDWKIVVGVIIGIVAIRLFAIYLKKIAGKTSAKNVLLPALTIFAIPILTRFFFGEAAVGGLLAVSVISGLVIGIFTIAGDTAVSENKEVVDSLIKGLCIAGLLIVGFIS